VRHIFIFAPVVAQPSLLVPDRSQQLLSTTCGESGDAGLPGPDAGHPLHGAGGSLLITDVEVQAAACRDRVDQGL